MDVAAEVMLLAQDARDPQRNDTAVGEPGVENRAPGEAERGGRRAGQDHLPRLHQAGVGGPDRVDGGRSRRSSDDEHGRQRDPGAGDGEGMGDVVGQAGRAVALHGHLPGELCGPGARDVRRVGGSGPAPARGGHHRAARRRRADAERRFWASGDRAD